MYLYVYSRLVAWLCYLTASLSSPIIEMIQLPFSLMETVVLLKEMIILMTGG